MQHLSGPAKAIDTLAVSPDSRYLVAGPWPLRAWDLRRPADEPRLLWDAYAYGAQFLGPAHLFATTALSPWRWHRFDLATGAALELEPRSGTISRSAAVHASGGWLVGSIDTYGPGEHDPAEGGLGLSRFDVTPTGLRAVGRRSFPADVCAVRPQGDLFVAGFGGEFDAYSVATHGLAVGFVARRDHGANFAPRFRPDGERLYVLNRWGVEAFDALKGGDPVAKIDGLKRREARDLAFHPAGRVCATVDGTGVVEFRDPDTLAVTRSYDFGTPGARAVAFTPDGTRCAVGYNRGKVLLFDVDE